MPHILKQMALFILPMSLRSALQETIILFKDEK